MSHNVSRNGSGPPLADLAQGTGDGRARRIPPLKQPSYEEAPAPDSIAPAAGPARGLPRRLLPRLGLVVAAVSTVAALVWAGHDWWTVGRYLETTDDAYVGGNV